MSTPIVSSCYCLRTRQAASAIKEYYDRLLQPAGITARQYSLLLNVDRLGTCSTSELAGATDLDRSTLTRSLRPLIRADLLADEREEHARNSRLVLTAQGRDVLRRATVLWEQAQRDIESRLGQDGLERLALVLEVLNSLNAGQTKDPADQDGEPGQP